MIGPALLLLGVYPPFLFVYLISLLSIPLALLLPPGARDGNRHKRRLSDTVSSTESSEETENLLSNSTSLLPTPISRTHNLKEIIATARLEFKRCFDLFVGWKIIQYGYAAALVVTLGKQALHILLQYVSKRFGVSIAKVCSCRPLFVIVE